MSFWVWLIVAAIMAGVEAASAGLITLWFVVGALGAFAANLLGASDAMQLGIFLVVSVLCLVCLRPVFVKYRNRGQAAEPTLVGQTAIVTEDIDNDQLTGRVQTPDHMSWAALSADGSQIQAGAVVTVTGQESVKLIVERKQS